MKNALRVLIFIIGLFFFASAHSQFVIKGKVFDKRGKQPIEFSNVYSIKNKAGGTSDASGSFSFKVAILPDTIIVSCLGYRTIKYFVASIPLQNIEFYLEEEETTLSDVTLVGYKDPGKHIMQEVLRHKGNNDLNRFDNSICNEYRKMEIDVSNLNPNNRRGFFNAMARIYNYESKDTSGVAAPIYFSEKYFRNYKSSKLQTNIEHLIAEKKLGLPTDNIARQFGKFEFSINIYNAEIPILKIGFISPVSELGLLYYKFEIKDTTLLGNGKIFKIKCIPRFKNENTFEGLIWIEDESFAVTKYTLKTSEGNNLNFINSILIDADFVQISDVNKDNTSFWLPYSFSTKMYFENGLELLGLPIESDTSDLKVILKNTSFFNSYTINNATLNQTNFFSDIYLDLPKEKTNDTISFVDSFRIEKLTNKEQALYRMNDSLKQNKKFIREMKLTSLFATGYWEFGNKLRIGPYSSLVSTNAIEGLRFRCNFWTLPGVSRTVNYNAHLAYGFKDKLLKGSFGIKYVPIAKRYMKSEINACSDYDLTNDFDDALDADNVFTLALRKNVPAYMVFQQQIKISQEIDINSNWSLKAFGQVKSLTPSFDYQYYKIEDDSIVDYSSLKRLNTTEIGLNIRYAHNERTTFLNYDKIRIATTYPVFSFQYLYGFELIPSNYFEYHKFVFNLMQEMILPLKGNLFYYASIGKLFGKVPAILLFAPQGNAYYIANKYIFNNMLPYEFVADQYASILTRYNMGGLILDKIPLLNQLKLRERFIFNSYWGKMSQSNKEFNNINSVKTTGNIPYTEAGFGIGNIFKVLAVDAIWRLSQIDPKLSNLRFGIYTSLVVQF